jgi:hypothetical protein
MFFPYLVAASFVLLSACVPPPVEKTDATKAPVVVPSDKKTTLPNAVVRPEVIKPVPSQSMILPSGWTVMDPKGILEKVEYKPEQGGVLFTLKPYANLELFSAEDAEKRSYYKGRLNGAHLVALPPQQRNVLIIFTNRQNARSSVLLKYTN